MPSLAQTTAPSMKPATTPAALAPAFSPAATIPAQKAATKKTDAGPGWFEFLFWSPLSGWIVGLAGIAATAYFALRAQPTKKLGFSCRNFAVLKGEVKIVKDLKVFYNDEPVTNFTVSALDFWNAGSATIYKDDVASKDPIRVTIDGGRLLKLQSEVMQDDVASNLEVIRDSDNEDSFRLTFDFLDPGKGGKFGIYHTSIAPDPVHVTGTIKGGGHPTRRSERLPIQTLAERRLHGTVGLLLITGLCAILAAWMERTYQTPMPAPLFWALLVVSLSLFIALLVVAKDVKRVHTRTEATAAGEK